MEGHLPGEQPPGRVEPALNGSQVVDGGPKFNARM